MSQQTEPKHDFFVETGDNERLWFETQAEAIAACNRLLNEYRIKACADGEWDDCVMGLSWGTIVGYTTEIYDKENDQVDYRGVWF